MNDPDGALSSLRVSPIPTGPGGDVMKSEEEDKVQEFKSHEQYETEDMILNRNQSNKLMQLAA